MAKEDQYRTFHMATLADGSRVRWRVRRYKGVHLEQAIDYTGSGEWDAVIHRYLHPALWPCLRDMAAMYTNLQQSDQPFPPGFENGFAQFYVQPDCKDDCIDGCDVAGPDGQGPAVPSSEGQSQNPGSLDTGTAGSPGNTEETGGTL